MVAMEHAMARNPNPNIVPAIEARREASRQKRQAVEHSLKSLLTIEREGGPRVTKALVCRTAKVSKTFLFSHPDLDDLVDAALQGRHSNSVRTSDRRDKVLIESLHRQLELAKRQIKKIKQDLVDLEAEEKVLFGRIADLTDERDELRKKLEARKR